MDFVEDSYEKALRIYGSDAEKEMYELFPHLVQKRIQVIGKQTITTYKKNKKSKNKVVYKL